MSKHTPGPWKVDDRFDVAARVVDTQSFEIAEVATIAISADWQSSHPDEHWGTADESHIEREVEEVEATTRLIAAAPELFEACKLALQSLESELPDGYYTLNPNGAIAKLEAAIAKAEGAV